MILTGSDLFRAVQTVLSGRRALCAVAFWGHGSEFIVRPTNGRDVRVICNLHLGGTNPAAIKQLLEDAAEVRHNPALHAKVYIGDDTAIVCSANASVNGLGLNSVTGPKLIEVGTLVSAVDSLAWFEELWSTSSTIRMPDDFVAAWAAYLRMQKSEPDENAPVDAISMEDLRHLSIRHAAIVIMNRRRSPMTAIEIATDLARAGFTTGALRLADSVYDTLREYFDRDFVRVERGVWALKAWPGITAMPATVSQLERQNRAYRGPAGDKNSDLSARVKAGLRVAKERGVRFGPPTEFKPEMLVKAKELRAAGLTYEKIAAELGFSIITIKRKLTGYDFRAARGAPADSPTEG